MLTGGIWTLQGRIPILWGWTEHTNALALFLPSPFLLLFGQWLSLFFKHHNNSNPFVFLILLLRWFPNYSNGREGQRDINCLHFATEVALMGAGTLSWTLGGVRKEPLQTGGIPAEALRPHYCTPHQRKGGAESCTSPFFWGEKREN